MHPSAVDGYNYLSPLFLTVYTDEINPDPDYLEVLPAVHTFLVTSVWRI